MPECPYDLRDYLFDELSPAERSEVERYLEKSGEAREELQRLRLTHAALLSAPDEETPRRIAFVSDKVFEPSSTMRYWREFWAAAPRTAFGLATVLAVIFGGLWMVQPTVTADEGGWRVAFGASNTPAVVAPETSRAAISPEQVRQIVLEALAEREQQQRAVLAEMLAARQGAPAGTSADVELVKRDVRELRQDIGDSWRLMQGSIEKLYEIVGERSTLASAGR